MNVGKSMMTKTENADVDHVLQAYFRSEAPHSWAPPVVSAGAAPKVPMRKSILNGRTALAASLALLIGGQFLISRHMQTERATGSERPAVDVASPAHKKPRTTSRSVGAEHLKPAKPETK